MELVRASPEARSRNLVFTSAGDHSNLHHWLKGHRDFDLWIVYYGDQPGKFQRQADIYLRAKGAKFQNLHYAYQRWPELFAQYDAVMVMDDDILIDATALTRLFAIRRDLDLWVLQPAFRQSGKISWDITRVRTAARVRYTNFVEMACPLFRRDKLDSFMAVYTPELLGYGEDWWFLNSLGPDLENHVAIVDEITCVNPYDSTKGGNREIDRLRSHGERQEIWERIKARYGLDEQGRLQKEYGRINKSTLAGVASLIRHLPEWAYFNGRSLARRLVASLRPDKPK